MNLALGLWPSLMRDLALMKQELQDRFWLDALYFFLFRNDLFMLMVGPHHHLRLHISVPNTCKAE